MSNFNDELNLLSATGVDEEHKEAHRLKGLCPERGIPGQGRIYPWWVQILPIGKCWC